MQKKNTDNSPKIQWASPPFSRVIKVSELNKKNINQFKVNLDKNELILLEKFIEAKSISSFSCTLKINLLKDKWEINAKININCTFECVISLEDLKYKLFIPFKRYLSPNQKKESFNIINSEDINSDTDPLTEKIDLGDIISEEIYLGIPKYPKKKGIKLKNLFVPEQETGLNPFKKLEKLKI